MSSAIKVGITPPTKGGERMTASHVRRDKAALFQWVQAPPGNRSSRKRPEQAWRRRSGVGVDPVSWTPFHLRRRCWDAEESPAIRAGISAPDGRAGAVRPNAGGAVTRVRANGASDLELGAPSRT